MRIITANARVVYICAARCACARYSSRAKTAKKIPVFCTFWRNPFTDFDDSLEPSSGFSLPFLCISRRLDQNWGSLLQTLPHTHTITQNYSKMLVARTQIIFWRGVGPKFWNPYPCFPSKTADFYGFFPKIFANRDSFLRVFLPQKCLILQFFRNFCEMGPSSKDLFGQNGIHV